MEIKSQIKMILLRFNVQNRKEIILIKRKELWNKSKSMTANKKWMIITKPMVLEEQKTPTNSQYWNEILIMNVNFQSN